MLSHDLTLLAMLVKIKESLRGTQLRGILLRKIQCFL